MKIGLFGGTLDPIHIGHLRVAEEVWERLCLDEIWFLPAFLPPHKLKKEITPFEKRLKMVELAIKDVQHFKASSIEYERDGISYSVDLLRFLNKKFENESYEFYFIIGSDAFMELELWKEYKRLPELANIVILKRPPHSLDQIRQKALSIFPRYSLKIASNSSENITEGVVIAISTTSLDISATKIRKLVQNKKSIRYLVPEEVRKFIMMERLYYNTVKQHQEQDLATSVEIAKEIYNAIVDNKGEKITVLDMTSTSPIADYFIITHGRSTRHVQGMANRMRRDLSKKGIRCKSVEGEEEGKWILMDFDDVIVHIFYEPVRDFYDLEGLWIEAPRLTMVNGQLIKEDSCDK